MIYLVNFLPLVMRSLLRPHQLHAPHLAMFTPWELKFSISDVVVQTKRVYDAFHDEFDSTPNRILELAETVKHLHDVLDNLRKVMEWYGLVP